MNIDRQGARRRVKAVTAWAAVGAAALTAGLAFGASRDTPAATNAAPTTAQPEGQPMVPQQTAPQDTVPPSSGFEPPAASSGPPAGMSGGS
jgi:hypothetical protein